MEITVETFEVLVTSRNRSHIRSWCAGCGGQVTVISGSDACLSGLSESTVRQLAESGRFHVIETAGGMPLICLNSLIESWKGEL